MTAIFIETGSNDGNLNFITKIFSDCGAEDDVGIRIGRLSNDGRGFVDFGES